MKIFVVIPAFNEGTKIGEVVRQLIALYSNVVVVDDGSDDGTGDQATQAGAITLCHIINRGQGAALKTGFNYAMQQGADIVVTFDADGQHNVDDIDHLVEPIVQKRADVVLGSRFLKNTTINMPRLRRRMLMMAVIFSRFASGLRVTDTHNGLRAFSLDALTHIRLFQDRMEHASEVLDEIKRNKLSFVEVPVTVEYSDYSKKKGQSTFAFGKILVKYILGRIIK